MFIVKQNRLKILKLISMEEFFFVLHKEKFTTKGKIMIKNYRKLKRPVFVLSPSIQPRIKGKKSIALQLKIYVFKLTRNPILISLKSYASLRSAAFDLSIGDWSCFATSYLIQLIKKATAATTTASSDNKI